MEPTLVFFCAVVVLGMGAQWLSWWLRLPAILLLLVFGVIAGRVANPDDLLGHDVLFPVVSLSVAVVLFEGGLSLRLRELAQTRNDVLRLITVGCLVTWVLAAIAGQLVFSDLRLAVLSGALFTVTGPTVIGPLLRHVQPSRRVGAVAKWEGIVIDPVGALLTVFVFEAVVAGGPQAAVTTVAWAVAKSVVVSVVLAFSLAFVFVQVVKRHWVADYLENPVLLSFVVGAFGISHWVQPESGLATVTLMGMVLANQKSVGTEHFVEFKENLRVLLVSGLFILLAARVDPRDIVELGPYGLVYLAILIVLVRPAAVFVSLLRSRLSLGERGFLAWLAPRGIVAAAVASVFSIEILHLAEAGTISADLADEAETLVALAFLVVVGTVAVYGLTSATVARWLGVAEPDPQGVLFAGANEVARPIATALQEAGFQVLLVDRNRTNLRQARMAGLPCRHGNVLSEALREDLNLGGIGRLLAMTPNDEVNTLASIDYADEFGRRAVFQLARREEREGTRRRGAILFAENATWPWLVERFREGAIVKTTSLTEEYGFEDFQATYGPSAVVLFACRPGQELTVCTAENAVAWQAGQTLIALVDPVQEEWPAERERADEADG